MSNKAIRNSLIVLIAIGLCAGAFFTYKNVFAAANGKNGVTESTATVVRGDLEVTISGTGTVQPISRYDIVPLVKGKILEAPFEEGANIKEGDLLYRIDDSDLSFNISKSQNGIEKLRINNQQSVESLNNLVVTAPVEGRLTNFTIKQGDQVSSSKIGDVLNDRKVIATIPFVKPDVDKIKVGQKATIQAVGEWASAEGTVKSVSNAGSYSTDGSLTYNVEIEFENTGTFVIEDTTAPIAQVSGNEVKTGVTDVKATEIRGTVHTSSGDVTSYYTGKLSYFSSMSVSAQSSGKVKQVYVKNNEWVKAGQKILELDNDSLNDTVYKNSLDLKDSQLSLDAQKKQLNDYNITSPISGTVIKKLYKAGDTIGTGSNSTTLMTVADLSKMIFTISVDELDIAKISKGQKVKVDADALAGESFEGEVTNVAMEGTTSNGVTTYPVEVTVSSPGKLKPGMNVNAQILVENKKNALYVPVAAVTKVGGKSFVTVKGNGAGTARNGTANKEGTAQGDSTGRQPAAQNGEGQQNSQRRSGANGQQGNMQRQAGQRTNGSPGAANAGDRVRKEVTIGINNDSFIEIVSGLNEGDVVYLPQQSVSRTQTNMPGGPGGMMAIPAGGGGFQGARPGGGGNQRR